MHVLLFYNCVQTVVKYMDMLCYVNMWHVTYSPGPPTLSQRHVDLCSHTHNIPSFTEIRSRLSEPRESKFAISHSLLWLLALTTSCTIEKAMTKTWSGMSATAIIQWIVSYLYAWPSASEVTTIWRYTNVYIIIIIIIINAKCFNTANELGGKKFRCCTRLEFKF